MKLLDYLFGDDNGIAQKIAIDENKKEQWWQEWQRHISNYPKRELFSKHFSFGNINKSLENFDDTLAILDQIELLISKELTSIDNEERLDEEILRDLQRLKSPGEILQLAKVVIYEKNIEKSFLSILREIHFTLKTELHLIKLIRKKPKNVKDLLLRLFEIIFHNEAQLYKIFIRDSYGPESIKRHHDVLMFLRAVVFEEKIKEELETDEEKFAREMVDKMHDASKHSYRKLAEDIYGELAEMAGAPVDSGEDITEAIQKLETLMKNDKLLFQIIKRLKKRYDDTKINELILAFRKAYDLGHFAELESWFGT